MQIDNPSGDFTSLAHLMLRTRGEMIAMEEAVADRRVPDRVRRIVLHKAASPAGMADSGSWGAALADETIASRSFLESLAATGVYDRLLPSMRQVPLRVRAAAATEVIAGSVVGEGEPRPVSVLSLQNHTLEPRTATTIVALSDELATAGGREAQSSLAAELRRGCIVATDGEFLGGLIDSGSPPVVTAGSTAAHFATDLNEMLSSVYTKGGARLFWIAGLGVAIAAAELAPYNEMSPAGGTLRGLPCLVTDSIPTDVLMLVDAAKIAAAGGEVRLDSARHASLQLADNPALGAQPQVNLWATNARAVRCQRIFAYERLSASAVASMPVGWAV
jgi:hypothetical protein